MHYIPFLLVMLVSHLRLTPVALIDGKNGAAPPQPVVETSRKWCGASALEVLCRGYGIEADRTEIRAICDPSGRSGGILTLGDLRTAARQLGLAATSVSCSLGWLEDYGAPCLTVHRPKVSREVPIGAEPTQHCLILVKVTDKSFYVVDPYLPTKVHVLSESAFAQSWTGEALLVRRWAEEMPFTGTLWGLMILSLLNFTICTYFIARPLRGTRTAVAILSCVCVASSGCGNKDAGKRAGADFEKLEHSSGDVMVSPHSHPAVQHDFVFRNRSELPLRLTDVSRGCSCVNVLVIPEVVKPGEAGSARMLLDLGGRSGYFETHATLRFAASVEETVTLNLSAFVVPPPAFSHAEINVGEVIAGQPVVSKTQLQVALGEVIQGISFKDGIRLDQAAA